MSIVLFFIFAFGLLATSILMGISLTVFLFFGWLLRRGREDVYKRVTLFGAIVTSIVGYVFIFASAEPNAGALSGFDGLSKFVFILGASPGVGSLPALVALFFRRPEVAEKGRS